MSNSVAIIENTVGKFGQALDPPEQKAIICKRNSGGLDQYVNPR
jgi:hypothetical protein